MGPSGYYKPPSLYFPSFGYVIALLGIILMTVEGFPQREGGNCPVEDCSLAFNAARQDLTRSGRGSDENNRALCTTYRTYRQCIAKTSGCSEQQMLMKKTIQQFVNVGIRDYNCSANGKTKEPTYNHQSRPPVPVPAMCTYNGREASRHCSLFGDPHLRTFYDEFQTCKVKGAWPLVENDHLTVMVTNDPVVDSTDATATSKLTVIVKGNPACTSKDFQTYQAQNNVLPSTFEDGRTTYGAYKSLELLEVDPGKHVEIHIRYIQTVVIVRQIGRYFTFSIQMPEDLVNGTQSSGMGPRSGNDLALCVRGCPAHEQINYQKYLSQRRYPPSYSSPASSSQSGDGASIDTSVSGSAEQQVLTRADAETKCREAKLVDFFFDSCVFDLMATGDLNFTVSALYALRDMLKLHPASVRAMTSRTSLKPYDEKYGDGKNGCGGVVSRGRDVNVFCLLCLTLLATVLCSR